MHIAGLDVTHRPQLTSLLQELHESRKPRILMALRLQDPLPEWITHVAFVEGQHVHPQPRSEFRSSFPAPPLNYNYPVTRGRDGNKLDKSEKDDWRGLNVRKEGRELVKMQNVNVRYNDRHVRNPLLSSLLPSLSRYCKCLH